MRGDRSAFTLIESMVVLGVLAILVGVSVPSYYARTDLRAP